MRWRIVVPPRLGVLAHSAEQLRPDSPPLFSRGLVPLRAGRVIGPLARQPGRPQVRWLHDMTVGVDDRGCLENRRHLALLTTSAEGATGTLPASARLDDVSHNKEPTGRAQAPLAHVSPNQSLLRLTILR